MQQPLPFSTRAELDINWDWTDWLAGSSIASYLVTPPIGITKVSDTKTGGVITAQVRLTLPGELLNGTLLSVLCKVTTNDTPSRTDERQIVLVVALR